jgi:Phage terminase large subunit (GpA)
MMPQVNSRLYADIADAAKHDPHGFAEVMAETDPLSWIQWIGLKTEKNEPIEFIDHAPLKQIYLDLHPKQANQKGSQIGMTETIINKLLWFGDFHNVTTIYTMPTAQHVYSFSQSRFAPVVKANPYLRQRMKGTVDNATLKRIGNSWFHFHGAQKDTQAISVPADILIHDEYDFSDIDVLDTYGKRTGASKLDWQWSFSTPTLPGWGINAAFDGTDQRHWIVRCERCNTFQPIEFERNIFKKRIGGGYYFGCYKCQKLLKRRNGFWLAYYPERATDASYDDKGRLLEPATGTRGYFINPLSFTFVTADHRTAAHKKAIKSSRPIAIKNFNNFDLGMPFASGESLITEETIRKFMRQDYPLDGINAMGVDQGDAKHWVILKLVRGAIWPIIAFGVTTDWEEIKRKFVEWDCSIGVVDALPNKDPARALVKSMHHRFWMAYYKDQHAEYKKVMENTGDDTDRRTKKVFSKSHKETQTLLVDRTESLDISAAAVIDGRSFLVGDKSSIGEDKWEFINQMIAMKRDIQENTKGIAVAVWVKLKPDHWRHAHNLACVAAQIKKPRGSADDIEAFGSLIGGGMQMPEGAGDMNFPMPPSMGNADFRDW